LSWGKFQVCVIHCLSYFPLYSYHSHSMTENCSTKTSRPYSTHNDRQQCEAFCSASTIQISTSIFCIADDCLWAFASRSNTRPSKYSVTNGLVHQRLMKF